MKSLTLALSTILTLCLSPTLQNEAGHSSLKNYSLAPLYLLFPNLLTTSYTEVTKHLTKNEIQQKNTLGFVATSSSDCNGNASLIPVYRFHNTMTLQYIFSTNPNSPKETTLAYEPDGIAFYASATRNEQCGLTVPLHSYWVQNHYVYTTDKTSAYAVLVEMEGGIYTGIVCYIWLNDEAPETKPTTTRPTVPLVTKPPTPPNCPVNPVALWRLYRPSSDNHFYTTSEPEANNAVTAYGYVREESPGKVAKSAIDCSCENNFVPIYRLYKPGRFEDHFYTASKEEADNAVSTYGYNLEGIEYYCSPNRDLCGATLPLYRY